MAAGPGRDYDPHEEMAGMDRRNMDVYQPHARHRLLKHRPD